MDPVNSLLFNLKSGSLQIVENILEACADYPNNEKQNYANSTNSDDGFSALQYAVSNCQPSYKVIELLLKYKANVNATNSVTGFSALQYAVSNAYPKYEVIKLLLKYKADVDFINCVTGFSILHSAVSNSVGKEIIELLLTHRPNVNKQNLQDCYCTPLLYALRNRYLDYEVIELLLKHSADIHARDFINGPNTALQYAAKHPKLTYELLDLLLKYKPNVNVINMKNGLSVLQYVVKNPNSNPKMIELLLASGANVSATNLKDGLSVLQYAVSNPNVNYKVIELLLKYNADVDTYSYGSVSTVGCVIRNTNIDHKVVELICTRLKYKICYWDLVNSRTNFKAVKVLVRRETDHFHVLEKCLECWNFEEKSHKVCFEILKWLVLQHFNKDPKNIKDVHTVKSVLKGRYMKLISGYNFRIVLFAFVNKCILNIISMKLDGLTALLFPKMKVEDTSIDTRIVANRLLNIWSNKTASIYLDIIESNIQSKDLLSYLLEFQISTRLTFEGTEKMLFLGYLPTLLIVEYLPLADMLSLIQAFYGFFKNRPTLENLKVKTCFPRVKLARSCKKQRLN